MYTGGYYLNKPALVRTGLFRHSNALTRPVSDTTIRALNRVQETPWRINAWLLDVAREAWLTNIIVADMPPVDDDPLPPPIAADVWQKMDDTQRREVKRRREEIHTTNKRRASRRVALLDKLTVAEEMRNRSAIWFPHFLDFRGRFYPINSAGPSPQGDDLSRALLMFADGVPLGSRGLYWLHVRAANTFGHDKLALDARIAWAEKHMGDIIESGVDPLGMGRFWLDAEEPWSFLATAREFALASETANPSEFASHLPIPLDGSCNGLQHLAAMGRDPIGARVTNLTAAPERYDIYTDVAQTVARMVSDDVAQGDPVALTWVGQIDRRVVKRAVMTTPYGVTDRGIREQLIDDGFATTADNVSAARRAEYLKEKIVAALGVNVASARAIMAHLQDTARVLCEAERPFTWTTPTGNTLQQAYYRPTSKRVSTLFGTIQLLVENPDSRLSARKQVLACAPNVIHSYDAAHLTMTVNAASDIKAWAVIHDSFGTHAANTDALANILREEFVHLYETDQLSRLAEEQRVLHPDLSLPRPPPLGEFDVREVLRSPFFFS